MGHKAYLNHYGEIKKRNPGVGGSRYRLRGPYQGSFRGNLFSLLIRSIALINSIGGERLAQLGGDIEREAIFETNHNQKEQRDDGEV